MTFLNLVLAYLFGLKMKLGYFCSKKGPIVDIFDNGKGFLHIRRAVLQIREEKLQL